MKAIKNTLLAIAAAASAICANAADNGLVRWPNEAADTVRLNTMLVEASALRPARPGEYVAWFGEKFLDTPYKAHTLEHAPEQLTVNLDSLDCTTFVETALALAITAQERRWSWRDFIYNLRRIRYRQGSVDGYASRLHYICDWALDNTARGNFSEVTNRFPKVNYVVKTISFMSENADKYPALADSATLANIKNVEIGYRNHRYPFIKTIDTSEKNTKAEFRQGDIVAFTSTLKNLDVTHMGIIVVRDGAPYVMHASLSAGKVLISETPLDKFLKRNRSFTGVRVFRLTE